MPPSLELNQQVNVISGKHNGKSGKVVFYRPEGDGGRLTLLLPSNEEIYVDKDDIDFKFEWVEIVVMMEAEERAFVPITPSELKKKIDALGHDYKHLTPVVEKDLSKIIFDTENMECVGERGKEFLGYHKLPNGMSYLGVYAGGDWESPVYFIIYWDGNKLRGYIPEEGNMYNTTTKQAYGNDDEADLKNARKRWPDNEALKDDNLDLQGWFDDYDYDAMRKDIMDRIVDKTAEDRAVNPLLTYSDAELLAELKRRLSERLPKSKKVVE